MNKHRLIFALVLAAITAYLAFSAHRWGTAIRHYESQFVSLCATPPSTSSIFLDNDAYYWIGYAREMAETRKWRIRHTCFDNPPSGRSVHWSQSVSWLLLLTGWVHHLGSSESLSLSIESAAVWIGPLQYFFLILGTGILLFKRMGLVPSLTWMLNLTTLLSIGWSFHPMRPDHHGLHIAFVVSSLLCLILGGMGWVRSPDKTTATAHAWFRSFELPNAKDARHFFIASGILGGLGVWTGATVQLFGIGLFAAGAVLLMFFMPSRLSAEQGGKTTYAPYLWRSWAVAGSLTSIFFYFIEYAPSFPGMRLEVNNPLYAVSWFCFGEALVRLSASKTQGKLPNRWLLCLFSVGAVLLPLLLLFGPSHWHAMRDPLMQRLHEYIDEFRPYRTAYLGAFWINAFKDFGVLPFFVVLAPFLVSEKKTTLQEWAALWMTFLPALAYALLTLWQIRWMNFFAVSSLLLAVFMLVIFWRHQKQDGRVAFWFYPLVLVIAGQSVYFLNLHLKDIVFRDISREPMGELIAPILQRQFAEKLGAMDTNHTIRVMAGPHLAARLHYYGGIPCVASYYWENLDGLRDTVDFFATDDDQKALRIAQDREITHVVLPPSPSLVGMFYYVKHGARSESGAQASLAGRMLIRPDSLPPWIKRDTKLERALQPGFLFAGQPIAGTLQVFTIRNGELE